jgi:hypothetical protein
MSVQKRNEVTSLEDLRNLYCALNVVLVINLKKNVTGVHVAHMEEYRNEFKLFGGKNLIELKYFGTEVSKKENLR